MNSPANSPFLKAAYLEIVGIMVLVCLIAWSCITGHIVVGAMGLVILPFWTAAGYIALSVSVVRASTHPKERCIQPVRDMEKQIFGQETNPAMAFQS